MSYINEILAFQGFVQDKSLSSGQIALWYALMYINNKCQWQEWFTVANKSLESNSGLTRQGIAYARNILKQHGLIDFKSRGTKATLYKMVPLSRTLQTSLQDSWQDSLQDSCQSSLQGSLQTSLQGSLQTSCTLTRKEKNRKDKNNIPPISPNGKNCFQEFAGDNRDLLSALQDFEEMRNKSRKPLTNKARQMIVKDLKNLSSDPKTQIAILEQSIKKSWLGVFPLHKDAGNKNKPSYDIDQFDKLGYDVPEIES